MSNPVTTAEIEDVLSSIRRLVSEDVRNALDEVGEMPQSAGADRLVLTPSLRVAEDLPPQEVQDEGHHDEELAPDDEAFHDEEPAHDDEAEEAALDDAFVLYGADEASEDHAEDHGEDQDEYLAEAEPEPEPETDWHSDDAAEDAAAETEPEPEEPVAPWDNPDATLYEAAAQHDGADWLEKEPEEDALDLGESEAEDHHEVSEADPEPQPDPQPEPEEAVSAMQALHAVIAESARPHGDQADEQPEEEAGLDRPVTEPLEWHDVEAEAPQEAPEPEAAAYEEPVGTDLLEDETFLDEGMLRELVRDIVREELQGALGERITRNVRKLVRREINRALSLQDME